MQSNGIHAYQETNVTTADPKRLLIMCYDKTISSLKVAKEKYSVGDFEGKAEALSKAQAIIAELINALDFEKGGSIAQNLNALYNYMLTYLTETDFKKNPAGFDDVVYMLEELKSAWEEIFYGETIMPQLSATETHARANQVIL